MSWNWFLILSLLFWNCSEPEPSYHSALLSGYHYLEIPHSEDIAYLENGNHTIQFWFRADTALQNYSPALFMLTNSTGGNEYGLYLSRNFGGTWMLYAQDKLQSLIRFDADARDGRFHYLALTINYQRREAMLRLDTLQETFSWPDSVIFSGSNLLIGADYDDFNDDVGNFWLGEIDELRIWREILDNSTLDFHYKNPAKVTRHYNSSWENRLIGLWRMNSLSNGYINDDSGNGNNARFISVNGDIKLSDKGYEHP